MTRNNILLHFGAFVCMLFCVSCFQDKGNYDYTDINEVSIGNIEAEYRIMVGQSLDITPSVTGTKISGENGYSFGWYRVGADDENGNLLISEERNLTNFTPPFTAAGTYYLFFRVTDNNTRVTWSSENFRVVLENDIASGIIILSEEENTARVDFLNYKNGRFEMRRVNLSALPKLGKPLNIYCYPDSHSPYFNSASSSGYYAIVVHTETGAYRLRKTDFSYRSTYDLYNMIINVPDGFSFASLQPTSAKSQSECLMFTNEGNIMSYSGGGGSVKLWVDRAYVNATYDTKPFKVSRHVAYINGFDDYVLFNEDTDSFMKVANKGTFASPYPTTAETEFKFNNTGRELVWMFGKNRENTTVARVYAFLNEGEDYYILSFTSAGVQAYEQKLPALPCFDSAVEFLMTVGNDNNNLLYYRTTDKIYAYNIQQPQLGAKVVFTAPDGHGITLIKGIVCSDDDPFYDNVMVVTHDGSGDGGSSLTVYTMTPNTGELTPAVSPGGQEMRWNGLARVVGADWKAS